MMRYPFRTKWCALSIFVILLIFSGRDAAARRSHTNTISSAKSERVLNLSNDDRELYNALTNEQKKNLRQGKIEPGYNEWMVRIAKGNPFYKTENTSAGAKKTETVWLYTKKETLQEKSENKIKDFKTGWLSLHRVTRETTCTVGDVFVIFDRGVVTKISPDTSKKRYGSCEINTRDEMIPIKNVGASK